MSRFRRPLLPIALLLPALFVFLLVMFLPALFGSAEVTQGESPILDMAMTGFLILPALTVVVVLAVLFAAFRAMRM